MQYARASAVLVLSSLALIVGCDEYRGSYREQANRDARMATKAAMASRGSATISPVVSVEEPPPVPVTRPTGSFVADDPITAEQISELIPDPDQIGNTDLPSRPKVHLTLEEAIRRTLRHSLQIQVEGYNPAVAMTEVVEAEAIFDAVYFLQFGYLTTDSPPNTPFTNEGLVTDGYQTNTGLRQLLPSGTQIQGSWQYSEISSEPTASALYYPQATNAFVLEMRQPLLRGFGVDFNRAEIMIRKNDRKSSVYTFERRVRDVLFDVHQAYWRLVLARRSLVITRELLEQTKETLNQLEKRRPFDALEVQIARTKALLGTRYAAFIEAKNQIKNAEDQLKNLINDPELNLALDIEIVPVDPPIVMPVVTDRLAEIQSALRNRSEFQEGRLAIENARIAVGVSRNQLLPQFDVLARFTLNGVDENFGAAVNQSLEGDYVDYFFGVEFEVPIGNRARISAFRRQRLLLSQSLAALRRIVEDIILDVNTASRDLQVNAEQISPNRASVLAAIQNLTALIARTDKFDPPFLDSKLTSQQTLAQNRQQLLQALVNYNIALANLERSKGTLLKYHNIFLSEDPASEDQ